MSEERHSKGFCGLTPEGSYQGEYKVLQDARSCEAGRAILWRQGVRSTGSGLNGAKGKQLYMMTCRQHPGSCGAKNDNDINDRCRPKATQHKNSHPRDMECDGGYRAQTLKVSFGSEKLHLHLPYSRESCKEVWQDECEDCRSIYDSDRRRYKIRQTWALSVTAQVFLVSDLMAGLVGCLLTVPTCTVLVCAMTDCLVGCLLTGPTCNVLVCAMCNVSFMIYSDMDDSNVFSAAATSDCNPNAPSQEVSICSIAEHGVLPNKEVVVVLAVQQYKSSCIEATIHQAVKHAVQQHGPHLHDLCQTLLQIVLENCHLARQTCI
ncbi:hypothetical protein F5J12DRAFT_787086 [Pisolithus orientalis]|uniref:uncharacterized protein n=1 Tax=Pisolithus orientalis TaxID=936130 RepID=UPI00222402CD|nr:uncharacterized protein F5J12DRAFT_787086 [Pisolithus orientalis]KAI5987334.1 hypothetical protein F5J12DRAFT_787086 [Pisolithus orientalis]